jgi:hypothetical protein
VVENVVEHHVFREQGFGNLHSAQKLTSRNESVHIFQPRACANQAAVTRGFVNATGSVPEFEFAQARHRERARSCAAMCGTKARFDGAKFKGEFACKIGV